MKITLVVAGLLTIAAAQAEDAGLALAKKSGCLACHAQDKKVLGPSYKDIAAKYKGQAGAETRLVAKVKNGGGGVWGSIPMPPSAQVSEADLHTLVKWVLSQ
ncbi:MAG: c-type cytochrome [Burkholderiales bacterium]